MSSSRLIDLKVVDEKSASKQEKDKLENVSEEESEAQTRNYTLTNRHSC